MKIFPYGHQLSQITLYLATHSIFSNQNTKPLKEAQSAITELKSRERWNVIKPSGNIDDIREFINQYPNSSCRDEAQKRICELEGVEFFQNGDLLDALNKFDEAGGKYSISSTNQSIYDKCKEFQDYKNISSETDGETFLKHYPNSVYYNQVSNNVALAKASSMSIFSTEYTFNDVLSYAKDDVTRNEVKRYIEIKKDSYRKYKRNERKNRIMANGGYVQFGFELIDFGLNTFVSDRYLNILYYNVGASVKVGNYKAPIQFEVGIKPGVFAYDYYDSDDSGGEFADATYKFHMPVYAKLKVNICSVGNSCKLYAAGLATYNAIKVKDVENDFSVGGGLGFAWKRWDWLTLYYKQDVSDKYNLGNKFLGTSLVYYL